MIHERLCWSSSRCANRTRRPHIDHLLCVLSYVRASIGAMGGVLGRASEALSEYTSRPAYRLSDGELTSDLVELEVLGSRVTAAKAFLAREAQARNLQRLVGSASIVTWLRELLHVTGPDARRLVNLREMLDRRPVLADAVDLGVVNIGQAAAIGRVLADVPDQDPTVVDKVEATLLREGAKLEPTELRTVGDRVLAHVNP